MTNHQKISPCEAAVIVAKRRASRTGRPEAGLEYLRYWLEQHPGWDHIGVISKYQEEMKGALNLPISESELDKQAQDERIKKIHDHMRASNALWRELEQAGYHSGGWDSKTDMTAIFRGVPPFSKCVGYVSRDLKITWIKEPTNGLLSKETEERK